MFNTLLEFLENWYNLSAKEHLATGFGVLMVSVLVFALGSAFSSFIA